MYAQRALCDSPSDLIQDRIEKHRSRFERLQCLIRRRTAIEERMLDSIKNIENAFNFADKAISSALGHRTQVRARNMTGLNDAL